ncbi:hypothetical protein ACWCQ1_44035 [Streptomyces sp. NPDC002144]
MSDRLAVLRALVHGNVRQLVAVHRWVLAELAYIDVDSLQCSTPRPHTAPKAE